MHLYTLKQFFCSLLTYLPAMQINIYYIQKLKLCDRTKCLHADADFAILTYLLTMVCMANYFPSLNWL